MNIEKLPSGAYRIRKMVNRKEYRVTVDHKPNMSEAFKLITAEVEKRDIPAAKMSFETACDKYIESKSNVLSPSSIRGYKGIVKAFTDGFKAVRLPDITLPIVQTEINSYSEKHSPKSVYNFSGFIMGVLNYYGVSIKSPKLPQKEKKDPYIPTKEEVMKIFAAFKGSVYEVPILLSCMGLRKSEICALTIDDLSSDNILTINKAKVQGADNKWVIKSTKTTASTRTVVIPDYIADIIRKQGYVYNGYPNVLYVKLTQMQDDLGIQHFSFHKMRHFFASYMHDLGYSDKQIQDMGGWKTTDVMKTVYTHAMKMDEAKKKAAMDMGSLM
jgi:integrase